MTLNLVPPVLKQEIYCHSMFCLENEGGLSSRQEFASIMGFLSAKITRMMMVKKSMSHYLQSNSSRYLKLIL